MTWMAIGLFLALAFFGMPLAFALGFGSLAGLWMLDFELVVMPQRMMHAVNSFPLMAIPLFMLAGELMVRAGIMDRLIAFANSLVGRMHGGLAHVTITSGTIFASVSGAAVASASAMGSTLVPSLRKYYPDAYSGAVIASAANLGPVIPPSNAMIVYALMAGSSVSVGGLFYRRYSAWDIASGWLYGDCQLDLVEAWLPADWRAFLIWPMCCTKGDAQWSSL